MQINILTQISFNKRGILINEFNKYYIGLFAKGKKTYTNYTKEWIKFWCHPHIPNQTKSSYDIQNK